MNTNERLAEIEYLERKIKSTQEWAVVFWAKSEEVSDENLKAFLHGKYEEFVAKANAMKNQLATL